MKLEGTAEFPTDPATVWQALHDAEILSKTIPGCDSIVATSETEYDVAVSLGVAAIKGSYTGTLKVDDVEFPTYYVIHGEGSGKPGYVKVKVECHLDANKNGTTMRWASDTEVGGLIAGIGGRVLSGISKHMSKQFFKALNEEMQKQTEIIQNV